MIYDLIIIGSGPAGLSASIYASRYRLKNLIIGKVLGGMITMASRVENYPGFVSISGLDLSQKMEEQVKVLGGEIIYDTAGRIENIKYKQSLISSENQISNSKNTNQKSKNLRFKIYTEGGKQYEGRTLILASGSERRKLDIPGEQQYLGRGVSYCTTCDAPFFRDKVVALIGGSDAAVAGAVHAAEFAKKVYIIYRKDKLRAEPVWLEEAERLIKKGKIEVVYNTNIIRILGSQEFTKLKAQSSKGQLGNMPDKVAAVELDRAYGGGQYLLVDGVFIEVGGVPGTSLAKSFGVELTEVGFIKVDEEMVTNIPGVFAAGDITDKSAVLPQMITACYQGALAAASAYKFLKGQKAPKILGV